MFQKFNFSEKLNFLVNYSPALRSKNRSSGFQ
jgi:hypothetical protein